MMNNYLEHYGIKGQRWNVRRFQNEDGTLTAEGRERYGHLQNYGDSGVIKKWTLGSEGGNYAFAKWRERRHTKNLNRYKEMQAKAEEKGKTSKLAERGMKKYQSKLDAQGAANKNLDAYRKHHTTAELVVQNHLGTFAGGNAWRHARARGESRLSAFMETATPIAPILRMARDKKAYGKYIVFAEPAVNEYDANGMRD